MLFFVHLLLHFKHRNHNYACTPYFSQFPQFAFQYHERREHLATMPVASNHHTRNQSHRSLQELGSIKDSQDLAFLNQPCYYGTNLDSSQITVGTIQIKRKDSEPVHSTTQLCIAFQDGQQTLLQLTKLYSVRHFCYIGGLRNFFADHLLVAYYSSRKLVHVLL
jgi:hypothetical protein